jgi:uncharacterized protein
MRKAISTGAAAFAGLTALWAATDAAAGVDCNARSPSQAQVAICRDGQLMRSDAQTERRLLGLARRMGYGQYLGMRHWHHSWGQHRDGCLADRPCLVASYRAQNRFLDRLQQCLDNALQRRGCLRNTLNIEREAQRR